MKKALLLLVAFLSSLSFSACNGAAKGPIYNFSNSDGAALTPYAVEYEDTVYFSSFYDELYSYRDGTVTLLETEFNAHSMTLLDNYLYYCGTIDRNPDGFYRRKLSKDGKSIGEPEKLYNFSSSESLPNAAWTDGKHLFFLYYDGLLRVSLADETETFWSLDWNTYSGSLLVWKGKLYLNIGKNFILTAIDLKTGDKEIVSEQPAIALGVLDGELFLKPLSSASEDKEPDTDPIVFTDQNIFYRIGTEIYTKDLDKYMYACTIPIQASLLNPQFLVAGDNLLMRSFYPIDPSEVDYNIPGSDMTDTNIYQYLLTDDRDLILLLADDVRYPLS